MKVTTLCISAQTLAYPTGGGHLWAYMNRALGFKSIGCRVLWLETFKPTMQQAKVQFLADLLRSRLTQFGLTDGLVLASALDDKLIQPTLKGCTPLEEAFEADLLLNQAYGLSTKLLSCFRRTALLDIDPGLLQLWMSEGSVRVAPHDLYFTTGETVGRADSRIPTVGLDWLYTPPCVHLESWPKVCRTGSETCFTTVTHWSGNDWVQDDSGAYANDKRSGFVPFLELPRRTTQKVELALLLGPDEDEQERTALAECGWRLQDSGKVADTPQKFRDYVVGSLGEFSCAKPSCVKLQNAWISDRTLCYLASGKPAIVQYTGKSRYLPDDAGLFRFSTMDEAVTCLQRAAQDYDSQSSAARALAEEFFDAEKVAERLLERAMP